jgi:hypothetical protein
MNQVTPGIDEINMICDFFKPQSESNDAKKTNNK